MIAEVEAGRIKRVIVKDMSRLGRDYLQVGMYTEIMFPNMDVHFIAVNELQHRPPLHEKMPFHPNGEGEPGADLGSRTGTSRFRRS